MLLPLAERLLSNISIPLQGYTESVGFFRQGGCVGDQAFCETSNLEEKCGGPARADRSEQWASGIRELQEFVATIHGRRTRWPAFLVASSATVFLIIFAVAAMLAGGIRAQLEQSDAGAKRMEGPASGAHFGSRAEAAQSGEGVTPSLKEEIHEVLCSVKSATERESEATLMAMLDGKDPDFLAEQKANAERLFRELEDIRVSFSEVEIERGSANEVLVSLRVKLCGQYVRTGRSLELPHLYQTISLRKTSGGEWKICSVK